jgi:hypothetical protein
MDNLVQGFNHNPMLWVWLVLAVALCYLLGWWILRLLVSASSMPGDAGCAGCLGGVVTFALFLLALVVMLCPLADWIVWLILIVLFIVILVALATKGSRRLGPLLLLFIVLFIAFVLFWNPFFKKSEPTHDVDTDQTQSRLMKGDRLQTGGLGTLSSRIPREDVEGQGRRHRREREV